MCYTGSVGQKKKQRKWMVKDSQGLVKGPYQTRQILIRIEKLRIKGDEYIAPHSTFDWKPLTQYPKFYDKLLETLQPKKSPSLETPASKSSHKQHHKSRTSALPPQPPTPDAQAHAHHLEPEAPAPTHPPISEEPTHAAPRPSESRGRVHHIERYYTPKAVLKLKSIVFQNKTLQNKKKASPYAQPLRPWKKRPTAPPPAAKKSPIFFVAGLVALALTGLWLFTGSKSSSLSTRHLSLLHPPEKKQQAMATKTLLSKFKQAQKLYATHKLKALVQAQNKLIAIVQHSAKAQLTSAAAAYLCLVDFELWPFTKATGRDLQAVDKASRWAAQFNPDSVEAKTCQAVGHMLRHNWQMAEYTIDDVLDQKQQSTLASFYYLKARVLEAQKKPALDYLTAALQQAPHWQALQQHKNRITQNNTTPMQQADQLALTGRCAQAQSIYKAVFEKNKNIVAALRRADCLWTMGLSFEALDTLKKVTAIDPQFLDAHLMQVDFLTRTYNFKHAMLTLKRAYSLNKSSYLLLKAEAVLALRQHNFMGAEKKLLQASQRQPGNPELYTWLAQAYLKQNKKQESYSAALKAVELNSQLPQAQVALAKAWVALKGLEFGGEYLKKLQTQHPQQKAYPLAWADVLLQHKQYALAHDVLRQVIQLWPQHKEAYIQLALALGPLGERQAAQEALWQAASLAPSDARPFYEAGLLWLEGKQYAEAQKQFLRALQLNPRYPLVHYYIGKASLELRQYDKALQYVGLEQKQNPHLAEPYLLSAQVYYRKHNWSACVQQYTQAFKYIQPQTLHYIQITRCYRRAGHLELADKMLHLAAEKESGHPEIYKELGILRELTSEKALAVEAYSQYLDLFPNAPDRRPIERRIQSLSR